MYTGDTICHTSTIQVNVGAKSAFDYLSDGVAQGDWTLGSMERRQIEDDLFSGTSIFSGAELFIKIDADPSRLIIYYHVGLEMDKLQPRNMVRVIPGAVLGKTDDVCLVTLLTWRSDNVDDDKWKLTCVSHETEMFIIKNRLENT
jgi:hypothetical protein